MVCFSLLLLPMEFNLKELLNHRLFSIGGTGINLSSLLFLLLFIIGVSLLLRFIRKLIYKTQKLDESQKFTIFSLTKYITIVISFILGMNMIGVNVSVLLGASAALLVGIGLGLQSLFSDFVSGIVLLLDSSVKMGDVIEVDKIVCRVREINLRTTTVLTRDDKYIILPNTVLTKNSLINWTHNRQNSRFEVDVRVAYGSPVPEVMKLLKETTEKTARVSRAPQPFVRFTEYAESGLVFTVFFWTSEVFRVENVKSDLRVAIFEALRSHRIEVPLPQRVLHIREGKSGSLSAE